MKVMKILAMLVLVYVGIVATFESLLGYFQPASQSTLLITTQAADGTPSERVLARLETDGQLYIAANHWPRAWYRQALANPQVEIKSDSEQGTYIAVPLQGAEHKRINQANALGLGFRILTGFPPRYLLRLDPAP
jgi:hypothetical protein